MSASRPVLLLALNNAPTMASGPGTIHHITGHSGDGSVRYVQLFDAATPDAVKLGTTTPDWVFILPTNPNSASYPGGIKFSRGIVAACTTLPTNDDPLSFPATVALAIGDL